MKIGLLGFVVEDANKGCEALTYSFLSMLDKMTNDDLEVHFFTPVASLDRLMNQFPNIKMSIGRLKIKDPKFEWREMIKSCDFVCDITCGDGFSDIYFPKNVFYTTLFKILVEKCGTPLYLLPQTYGPFSNKKLETMAKYAIKHACFVTTRDQLSAEYVRKLTKINPMVVTDLAFALPYDSQKYSTDKRKLNIGINVSGLLWNGGFIKENQFSLTVDYRRYITELILALKKRDDVEIHIIPHVIETDSDNIDGDVSVCRGIAKEHSLIAAPAFTDPIDAKSYISSMDVFLGSRMHSTIAAYSSHVPVIPFSYSRKFEGLYENLNYDYVIHGCTDSTEVAVKKSLEWIENKDNLRNAINKSMNAIDQYLYDFKNAMRGEISKLEGEQS
ncbi:MAG: polysaccharide pyruvyl transferase family protein [Oscillospiraceae bacterium]|nr:polysaccharide pyruvyl transferase family protein [Ruminococcus sp.]MCD8345854.1 polysaccharide pyruvyl transferase family protein [Oscillospiraceae bacterium]